MLDREAGLDATGLFCVSMIRLTRGHVDADWSVELGAEDPVVEVPWASPDGVLRFVDLRAHPEHIDGLEEAQRYPEMAEFLRAINRASSKLTSVKCDVWESTEIEAAEEIFGGSHKVGSYCDVVFREKALCKLFDAHESAVQEWAHRSLELGLDRPVSIEWVVRRSIVHACGEELAGFAITTYVFGYGPNAADARREWEQTLGLLADVMTEECR